MECLVCYFNKLYDDDLQRLNNCLNKNVKYIEIKYFDLIISDDSNLGYIKLKNLEKFELYKIKSDDDSFYDDFCNEFEDESIESLMHVLKELSGCINLKNLILCGWAIDYKSFDFIKLLSNLKTFEISEPITLDISLVANSLIDNLLDLEEIKIKKCDGVSEFIKIASKIKLNRGDEHKLKIIVDFTDVFEDLSNLPLITLESINYLC